MNVVPTGICGFGQRTELGLEQVPVRLVAPPDQVEYIAAGGLAAAAADAVAAGSAGGELEQYRQAQERARKRRLAKSAWAARRVQRATRERPAISLPAWRASRPATVQDAATVYENDSELFRRIKQGELPAERACPPGPAASARPRPRPDTAATGWAL